MSSVSSLPSITPLRAPLRLLAFVAVAYAVIGVGLRLLLWAEFGVPAQVGLAEVPAVLGIGVLNDVVELSYLLIPLAMLLVLLPAYWNRPCLRRTLFLLISTVLFGMLFLGALEYFFFEEFDARFNLVAVDYLIYPSEVIGNIHDSYPVAALSAVLFAVALIATTAVWPWLIPRPGESGRRRQRLVLAAGLLPFAALVAVFARADAGSVFDNRIANELAANGPGSFFAALHTNHLEYPAYYRTTDAAPRLATLRADLARGGGDFDPTRAQGLSRTFAARPEGYGKLNVVVLSEESLGAEFVGAYGDARSLTPEFDRLTAEGVLFTRAYATGTRTVRGLEAMTASFPPIPSESILKRPGNDGIATVGAVLRDQGYHTSFLYGGYGTFDNMNAFYQGNGFETSDRTDIAHPGFANVWGVSDEDLFTHAIAYFDARAAEGVPFFSLVMSTSNHKPYTFPDGVPGVKPKGGGRVAGVRYADHAIGEFFRAARSRPWFKDTVFVVIADHGARVYGAAQVPLYSYEIPLLILAPGRLKPARVDTLTSNLDLAPTVLGLLGLSYAAPFFGQDVLHWNGGPRTLLFNHNHDVALLRDGHLVILGLRKQVHCQRYVRMAGSARSTHDTFTDENCDAGLVDLATAYYQTGYELFTRHEYQ